MEFILSPMLFNIYINDTADGMDIGCLLYADVIKLSDRITELPDCARISLISSRIEH